MGVSPHGLYVWVKRYGKSAQQREQDSAEAVELQRLRAEVKRLTEKRDILKKSRRVLCQGVRLKYAFIKQHLTQYSVRRLCEVLQVHLSGYYAWRRNAHSQRHHEDQRLLALAKPSWLESGRVYGYRKVHHDLRALGESCSRHRVARLMSSCGWRAQVGYRRRSGFYGGAPHNVAANILDWQFDVAQPNMAWVTDITYIRTYEGWLYLVVVVDLFSRQVVGWSMDSRMSKE